MRRKVALKIKRLIDIIVAISVLFLSLPITFATAVAIYSEDRGPIFFKQKRAGLKGKEFTLIKFRSMKVNNLPPEEVGQVREEHPLVTRVGRIIRRYHIDEVPQMINVLKGDMSLVGPRATLPSQVKSYDNFQKRRLNMKPGITGWAQVNGNTLLDWSDRIRLDVWYIENWSLKLDLYIIIKTLSTIFFGERINEKALREAIEYEGYSSRNS